MLSGDFCQAVQQYAREANEFELGLDSDAGWNEFVQWVRAAFLDLQRIGPEEVQAEIQLFLDAIDRGAQNLFVEEDPQLDAASERFTQFVLVECGFDLDAVE